MPRRLVLAALFAAAPAWAASPPAQDCAGSSYDGRRWRQAMQTAAQR